MSVAPVPQLSDLLTGNVHHVHHLLRDDPLPSDDLDSETIESYGERLSGESEARAMLGGDLLRYDTLSDIQRGLNTIGNIIQIVTSILSLFGASNVDRSDNFESSLATLVQLGTSALKVGMSAVGEAGPGQQFASKVGVASGAPSTQLTPEETLHKQQVTAYIASLTPDQVKEKQDAVVKAVAQQATEQGLASEEATQLLHQTLEYNGLPQVGLHNPPSSSSSAGATHQAVPGLPVPGTLEHTVALGLFNAQQYINGMFSGTGNAADTKIGGGEGASGSTGGLLDTVAALPQSVSNAAVEVLKFVTPGASGVVQTSASPSVLPGQTYSEVVTGVDPTYAALGVLTTGALASVAYSYVASDQDIASSATSLALGAVDAIARNDLVENIASSKLVQTASHALGGLTGNPPLTDREYEADYRDYYNYINYDNIGYSDYDYDYEANDRFSHRDPLYEQTLPENTKLDKSSKITEEIEWYEPGTGLGKDQDNIPYVTYTEQHNPWNLMNKKKDTAHLYRSF